MKQFAALPAAALLALAACGDSTESTAEKLEEAAEQSDPAAAQVLENAAEVVEEQNRILPPNHPDSTAQQALEKAGDVQARTLPREQPAPPSMQAKPNRGERQTPPPKVDTGPEDHSAHEGNNH